MTSQPETPLRGPACQQARREHEQQLRCLATEFLADCRGQGFSCRQAADMIGMCSSTLGSWEHRCTNSPATCIPRGRPCRSAEADQCQAVFDLLDELGPRTGLPTLRNRFSKLAHRERIYLLAGYRHDYGFQHPQWRTRLTWHRPGTVWAIDFAFPPAALEADQQALLAVRDLASGYQLAWLPVPAADAQAAQQVLQQLFEQHGPPLLIKLDNGSPFVSLHQQGFFQSWNVLPLFSPPATPQYNGSCEASIAHHKARTQHHAQRHGHPELWTSHDTEAARLQANQQTFPRRLKGNSPDQVFSQRAPLDDALRQQFLHATEHQRSLEDNPDNAHADHYQQAQLDRIVIPRVLVDLGLLSFQRRRITPSLKTLSR